MKTNLEEILNFGLGTVFYEVFMILLSNNQFLFFYFIVFNNGNGY
ncbi:hypothetical protein IWX80_003009 [Flavobacterium sp. CAN_S2]|jgi:hypothetical protein